MIELQKGGWNIKGTWHSWTSTESDGAVKRGTLVCCPICGTDAPLSKYTVAEGGAVTPTYVCAEGCGFRDQIRLAGWGEA